MAKQENNIGKTLFVVAIAGLTTYGVYLIRKVKAAKNLRYQLTKIQLYKFASGGNLTFRVWVNFTNLEKAALTIQQLYLDIFLKFNGSLHRIATLNTDNQPITIPGLQTVSKSFDVVVPWANLGIATLKILTGFLTTRQFNFPTSATVDGQLKAVGFTIKINEEVPFSADMNTQA